MNKLTSKQSEQRAGAREQDRDAEREEKILEKDQENEKLRAEALIYSHEIEGLKKEIKRYEKEAMASTSIVEVSRLKQAIDQSYVLIDRRMKKLQKITQKMFDLTDSEVGGTE